MAFIAAFRNRYQAEIDGIKACARIRNEPRYADVPIIMVTQLSDMDSLSNAFAADATMSMKTHKRESGLRVSL